MSEKKSWKDRVREAFKTKDCDSMEKVLSEVKDSEEAAGGGGVHLHLNGAAGGGGEQSRSKYTDEALEEKFKKYDEMHAAHDAKLKAHDEDIKALRGNGNEEEDEDEEEGEGNKNKNKAAKEGADKDIEGELEEEAPVGTGDKARKAKDSAYLDESYQATVAMAEILAPGIRVPTFDRAAKPGDSLKNICGLRRKALQQFVKDDDNAEIVKQIRRGRTLDAAQLKDMECGKVRDLFFAAGALKKAANNGSTTHDDDMDAIRTAGGGLGVRSAVKTPADLNKRMAEFYKQ